MDIFLKFRHILSSSLLLNDLLHEAWPIVYWGPVVGIQALLAAFVLSAQFWKDYLKFFLKFLLGKSSIIGGFPSVFEYTFIFYWNFLLGRSVRLSKSNLPWIYTLIMVITLLPKRRRRSWIEHGAASFLRRVLVIEFSGRMVSTFGF